MKKKLSLIMAGVVGLTVGAMALPACSDDSYDLVYASWNLSTEAVNNVERQMIKEFENRNNVKVKIEESIAITGYDDSISMLAARNKLPDVFMLSNMNFGLKNRYVSDITDLIEADESNDWEDIPKPIEEAVHYKSGVYGVPFAMHMMGYFVNVDLLKENNLDSYLDREFTYDNFYELASTVTTRLKTKGIMGLSHESTIFEWYPSSVNEDYGWFTWDGSAYHLDSDEFKEGLEKTAQMRSGGITYEGLSEEDRADFFESVTGYVDLWNKGRLALRWGYSYEVPDMMNNSDFEIRFLGVPGGRTPVVGDYLAISNTCENRELAYKFAKWMSFDPAGIRQRIALEKDVTNTMPLTTDEELIAEYFDKFDAVEGLQSAFDTIDNGIVESVKVVSGYNLSRWKALTGFTVTDENGQTITNCELGKYLDLCWLGIESYAEHAIQANALANSQYTKAIAQFEAFYE